MGNLPSKNEENKKINTRPSWEEYFKEIVKVTATRSPCKRLQVGCLIVKDNRIISQGYNGSLSGHPHESVIVDNHEMATIHAEQNAIIDCAKRGVSCQGANAYITHFPCIHCFKVLSTSGIQQIRYINDYKYDENVSLLSEVSNVKITKIRIFS